MSALTERFLRGRERYVCDLHDDIESEMFSDQIFESECNKYRHVGLW